MKKLLILAVLFANISIFAKEVEHLRIMSETEKVNKFIVKTEDETIVIKRVMTKCAFNKGWLQPLVPAKGITPVTELELLKALNDKNSMVVDMRTDDWYLKATIPTAINIPYTEVSMRMDEFGCKQNGKKWDCKDAKDVYAFCNGPVCPQSPIAMKAMIRDGFPASKIFYYRGGMLDWHALGFTTVKGEF